MSVLLASWLLFQEGSTGELIHDFLSESIEQRSRASKEIRKRGLVAIPLLKAALGNSDAEVVSRCREVMGLIFEDSGREAISGITGALAHSHTVKVTVSSDAIDLKCFYLGKEGGRVRIESEIRKKGLPESEGIWNSHLICDGTLTMFTSLGPGIGCHYWGWDGKDYRLEMWPAVARVGVVISAQLWSYARLANLVPKDLFSLGNWACEEEDRLNRLEYSIKWVANLPPGMPLPTQVKLWYEPATLRPVRRVLAFGSEGKDARVTEEFVFDADIPDATFKVPEGQIRR